MSDPIDRHEKPLLLGGLPWRAGTQEDKQSCFRMSGPDRTLPSKIGRYRVVRELGKGAMGRVLLAHDPVLDRDVAIKHLRADLRIAPEQVQPLLDRMRQEARASARVSHPNLVALHDMGEDPHVGLYLVFEYIEGPTLKDRLERGPLKPKQAARLLREVGSALSFAHAAGIVHRDVKPDNVILSQTGAKVADFGIARLPDSTLTQGTGIVLGTPAYSAPEAISGSHFSALSDQFSFAATAYEAISGRRAFPGDDAVAVAARITNEEPPRIAEVCRLHRKVDTVLARGLSKHPKSRFPSCEEFGMALSTALVESVKPEMSPEARVRSQLPTIPDQYHQPPKFRSTGNRWSLTLLIALSSIGLTWAVMTFVLPPATSAQAAAQRASEPHEAEENPAPIAWLRRSPREPGEEEEEGGNADEKTARSHSVKKPAASGKASPIRKKNASKLPSKSATPKSMTP